MKPVNLSNFIETVVRIVPMYWVRAVGGTLVLISFLIMMYNLYKTARQGSVGKEEVFEAYALEPNVDESGDSAHRKLEGMPTLFAVLSAIAILIGSAIEIVPSILSSQYVTKFEEVTPYRPLELLGRDIYVREGCYLCHSQTVRTLPHEVLRYGKASQSAEFVYDYPFQWGSKRTGPDLARVGGKYSNLWHYRHFAKPQEVTAGSIMPRYGWLYESKTGYAMLEKKMTAMQTLGVPYSNEEIANAETDAKEQAAQIIEDLGKNGGVTEKMQDKEVIALIAYIQRLGIDYGSIPEEEEELEGEDE